MAITKTWEINTLERELADGYVKKVIYRVIGIDGSEEKARATGEVELEKPETLVPYKDLTESTVLGWVKAKLNTEVDLDGKAVDRVALIEKSLEDDAENNLNAVSKKTKKAKTDVSASSSPKEDVLVRASKADPNRGRYWAPIRKDFKNWRDSIAETVSKTLAKMESEGEFSS